MKKLLIILTAAFLVGCEGPPDNSPNQCIRAELFNACMKGLPVGPQATKYNDWDEVVDSCATVSYRQSIRLTKNIPMECRAQ